jgi:hypothetical protein
MDYLKLYDALIDRARKRSYTKGMHRHRIIPGHCGGKSTDNNICYLSIQEHRIVHKLRYKIWNKVADLYAAQYLGGRGVRDYNHTDIHKRRISESHKGMKKPWVASKNKSNVGLVSCYDATGKFLRVPQEEYRTRSDLKALNKGRTGLNKGNKRPDLALYNRNRKQIDAN